MKKFILCLIALVSMFTMARAEEVVTLKGGVTALMHPGCNGYENWGHTIQAGTSLQFTHWITPTFGVAVDGTMGWENGSKYGAFQTGHVVNFVNVSALAKLNFNNLFHGFRGTPDKFEVVAAVGPGWVHGFYSEHPTNDLSTKMQLEFNINLTPKIQLNIVPELNYNLTRTRTGAYPRFDSRNAWYGLMAGVSYKFGKEFKLCPYKYTQEEVDLLNAQINELRNKQPETITQVVEKIVYKDRIIEAPIKTYVVAFDYGKSTLDNAAMNVLDQIPTDVVVDIKGEASYPGTDAANNRISEKRAQAVASYLRNRGITIGSTEGLGATGHQIVTVVVR